ncbi:uncharacterized protein LOC117644234 [Thrips palmi]|uniref:Uncharacterized protein LOC117644234 n=1 Tax=Thrips palmi TaxID=161013 RepID=A0A6P8ZLT1_THRPL|nr:uncharacterized protein LOC117644234 [Thrips palmi]
MQALKRRAREEPNDAPQRIIRQAVAAVDDPEVLAKLPERQSVRRVVNIHQNIGRPRNPRLLQDIDLNAPYTTTMRGTRFLLHDSGREDPDRVIVFCSEESLKVLCQSEVIYADGTFKTVPNQFGQCYRVKFKGIDTT